MSLTGNDVFSRLRKEGKTMDKRIIKRSITPILNQLLPSVIAFPLIYFLAGRSQPLGVGLVIGFILWIVIVILNWIKQIEYDDVELSLKKIWGSRVINMRSSTVDVGSNEWLITDLSRGSRFKVPKIGMNKEEQKQFEKWLLEHSQI